MRKVLQNPRGHYHANTKVAEVLKHNNGVQHLWAEISSDIIQAEEPFRTVSYQRRLPKVVGRRTDCLLKTVPRRLTCFVGRLDVETTADELRDFLIEAGISGVRCTKIKPKSGRVYYSAAFRVSCDESFKDIFYNEAIWPDGVELRDWIFYSRNDGHN